MNNVPVSARDLAIRLKTVARELEVDPAEVDLAVMINGLRFPLTRKSFQVDEYGTLEISLAESDSDIPGLKQIQALVIERLRQIRDEGFSEQHDDAHDRGELAIAAACYAEEAFCQLRDPDRLPEISEIVPQLWPWEPSWWRPSLDARRNLVKAGALILAAIGVIDRANEIELKEPSHG
ncbi:hypothetical protein [Pseudomonas sp. 273]|uniref:hypothetical protein n=1 Tax=Pseudomonas sp. 273 TaxID=75692 RepID=UPI0023D82D28|nr:hypothetical protein [Pseudomonas sp. 273]